MKLYDKSVINQINRSFVLTLNVENKRRNAYEAASNEVLRLFNSNTKEDEFDGFSAQEGDEEGDQ